MASASESCASNTGCRRVMRNTSISFGDSLHSLSAPCALRVRVRYRARRPSPLLSMKSTFSMLRMTYGPNGRISSRWRFSAAVSGPSAIPPTHVTIVMSPRRRLLNSSATDRLLLSRGVRRGSFFGARAAEDPGDGVVPLVARVLVHPIFGIARQRNHDLPRARVDRRIADGDLVVDRARVDAREAFDEAQGVAVRHAAHAS